MTRPIVRVITAARTVASAVAALSIIAGCAPRHVRWRDAETVIQPEGPPVDTQGAPQGYLVVAKPPRSRPGAEQMDRYPPVYLYDNAGTFLSQLPNNTEYPTALHSGDYILLIGEVDPLGPFRRLQVHVDDGRTTTVSEADILQAPSK